MVKEVCGDCFLDIGAEFFPGVPLRKDVMGETFSYEPAIFFLAHAEDDFHRLNSGRSKRGLQAAFVNELQSQNHRANASKTPESQRAQV
jgi:hypothetical protein